MNNIIKIQHTCIEKFVRRKNEKWNSATKNYDLNINAPIFNIKIAQKILKQKQTRTFSSLHDFIHALITKHIHLASVKMLHSFFSNSFRLASNSSLLSDLSLHTCVYSWTTLLYSAFAEIFLIFSFSTNWAYPVKRSGIFLFENNIF